MRASLYLLVFVCLFAASAVSAQRVIEDGSDARIESSQAVIRLAIESDAAGSRAARLELLDVDDAVKGVAARRLSLERGQHVHEFRIPLGEITTEQNENLAWYRLRYRVGDAAGIISLSQMLRDLFELRIMATDNILSGMNYRVRVKAMNPFTRMPAAGVKLEANAEFELKGDDDRSLTLRATGETDAEGLAVLDMDVPVEAAFGGDGEIKVTGSKNGLIREAEEDLNALEQDVRAITMTDKPIYQPGQMLNVRSIMMKGVEGPVVLPFADVEFRIQDEDETLLYREKAVTSAFGVAAISWRIPANAMLGDYTIWIRSGDGEQIASQRVKVSRYDLPNFAVSVKPSKPYYLPMDKEAEVEVRADYLFGKPVTSGKVRVVQEKSREWNWKEQKYDINEGEVREGETDKDGKFTARFDLAETHDELKDDRWDRYEDIKFAAYFTDTTTNKTEQRRFDVRVTREPIHVYLIRDNDFGNARLPMVGYVSTFYADGTPAECDVEVKASKEDEDKFKTVARLKTNSLGAGKFVMKRPNIGDPDDDLDLRIMVRDRENRRGTSDDEVNFDDDEEGIRVFTDRAIYKPGETVEVKIDSTVKAGTVYVDVVTGWSVIASVSGELKDGKATLRIPYQNDLRGELKIAAYVEDPKDDESLIRGGRGIIFPAKEGIKVEAEFDKALYKPNEEATVSFGVMDVVGRALESALGVVIFDSAVEERARTDADFGGMFSGLSGWLGYGEGFGTINIKNINELDLTKPISPELQTAAEIILHDSYYYPNTFRSRRYYDEAASVFSVRVGNQFNQIRASLSHAYLNQNYLHPTNDTSLKNILEGYGLDLAAMRDPWGMPYRAEFDVDKTRDIVRIMSSGPDKEFGTRDDLAAFTEGYDYFTPVGKAVDAAVKNLYASTGEFVTDAAKLSAALGVKELLDRFGRPYKAVVNAEGRNVRMRLVSAGKDGEFSSVPSYYGYYYGDDFEVWNTSLDIFANIEKRIAEIQKALKKAPMTEAEFRRTLTDGGVDPDKLRDGNGDPLYIVVSQKSRYWDRVSVENVQVYGDPRVTERRVITPVTQQVVEFTIKGPGRDRKAGTYDDVTFTQYVHVLSEQSKDDPKPVPAMRPVVYDANTGSIAGTVTDASGAVIPAATVTATNFETGLARSTTADSDGHFILAGLSAGKYTVRVEAAAFMATVISDVAVTAGSTTSLTISLEVGGVASEVTVTGGATLVESTSASVVTNMTATRIEALPKGANFSALLQLAPGTAKGKGPTKAVTETDEPTSTPRVREYFPETLLWQPEVVTNADGKAQVKFRMADNITTWKMYTIASTREGKIGFAEKEATAFQSFFVDLDPPKFLTAGDEIHLPTQVRNYTDKRQSVNVTMSNADWFAFLDAEKKQVAVDAGQTENAVFGFKAVTPVKDGKQRVTAVAQTDSDAIERKVTVRPDGHEEVHTESHYSSGGTTFNLDFPANALPGTQNAELRIYPNQLAHVAEAVEGLLQRPYGCGEQTISSTYPNVMILKFAGTGRISDATERKARKYLASGYERLLGYQVAEGGFSYWGGKDEPDLAVTAYALRFLADASRFITVDAAVVKKAEAWLLGQQRSDGSWNRKYRWETEENPSRAKSTTTYIARTFAMMQAAQGDSGPHGSKASTDALGRSITYLKLRNTEIDDPYSLSLFGLAALDSGDEPLAREIARRLAGQAKEEAGAAYWNLESNTAFNGWGAAGRVETTALVTQLLIRSKMEEGLVGRAMVFLLKNKDRYGVWYSTQTTINVLDTFVATLADDKGGTQNVDVVVNGRSVETVEIGPDKLDRIALDISAHLSDGKNTVELRSPAGSPIMAQVVAGHYIPWRDAEATGRTVNKSRALRLDYKCDRTDAAIMQEVSCSVEAERIGYRGYGMLLAEIGTPPGADVSRESLQVAMDADWSITRYDVLPDRVRLYLWSRAGGTKFTFKFRPRYAIVAQTPASVVYDYYNPEAEALVAPLKFAAR